MPFRVGSRFFDTIQEARKVANATGAKEIFETDASDNDIKSVPLVEPTPTATPSEKPATSPSAKPPVTEYSPEATHGNSFENDRIRDIRSREGAQDAGAVQQNSEDALRLAPLLAAVAKARKSGDKEALAAAESALEAARKPKKSTDTGSAAGRAVADMFGGGGASSAAGRAAMEELRRRMG